MTASYMHIAHIQDIYTEDEAQHLHLEIPNLLFDLRISTSSESIVED